MLVEKPVALWVSEINELEEASQAADRVCMPAHNYIYAPALKRTKHLIASGKLGKISSLWVIYNVFTPEDIAVKYGGVLRAICTHHAYSLLYLLGRPRRVMATASSVHYENLSCEDQAMIVCEMPGGVVANLWCSFAAKDLTSDRGRSCTRCLVPREVPAIRGMRPSLTTTADLRGAFPARRRVRQ